MTVIPWNDLHLINPAPALSVTPNPASAYFNATHRDGYNPNYKNPGDPEGHGGLDMHAPAGSDAVAPFSGDIEHAGWGNSGSGNVVCVVRPAPGGWWLARLLHLKTGSFTVTVGDTVGAGDLVAEVGCTGQCTYPHIHLEVRFLTVPYNRKVDSANQGIKLDPLAFGVLPGVESRYYEHLIGPAGPEPIVVPLLIHPGESSDATPLAMAYLAALGYLPAWKVEGRRLSKVKTRRTRQFQFDQGLTVDGTWGPETWAAAHSEVGELLP